ncbi:MAG TPA: hypothetical protein VMM60_11635 [Ilumatobacter sp.]|nr:hypothetical protein [Ilumatobacter sp.]
MFDRPTLVASHVRRAPLGTVLAAAAVGGCAVLIRALTVDTSRDVLQFARLSAVLIAAAAAAAMENTSAPITNTASLPRSVSLWLSAAITGLAAIVMWVGPVMLSGTLVGDGSGLPLGGLLIEFVALLVVGWLLTESVTRVRGPVAAGTAAGALLLLGVITTLMTPHTIEWLWRGPDPHWWRIHLRWALIAVVAGALLGLSARDAAAGRPSIRRVHPASVLEKL